ncbi:MAG: class I SAM-dependent methyltransferase [Nitrospirae bacterium]|nr:class I SAM-dependent methyltransferase [Nitrospirota bacterium]
MSRERVREAWQDYWARNRDGAMHFDRMSERILSELLRHCGDLTGRKVLEAGCGRGIISAGLSERGAEVSLLDISPEALLIAKRYFDERGLEASIIHGDIFDLPFDDETFDIVWNAGVMEHFAGAFQAEAIRGIARILKPGGLFISFNPSAGAYFYSAGKRSAERKGTWPYGPEYPVTSLQEICTHTGLSILREYPICFRENLSYLSYVSKHLRSAVKLILRPFPEDLLLGLFGGYLLVTITRKGK